MQYATGFLVMVPCSNPGCGCDQNLSTPQLQADYDRVESGDYDLILMKNGLTRCSKHRVTCGGFLPPLEQCPASAAQPKGQE